jgi:hypothetical protein
MALSMDFEDPFPGIGNIFIYFSQYYRWCKLNNKNPIVYTHRPEKIVGLKDGLFEFTSIKPENLITPECSMRSLFHISMPGYMNRIIDVPNIDFPDDIVAGFCFRFGDPKFDEGIQFMNDKCVNTMMNEMKKYNRVFVCSNKNSFIKDLKKQFGEEKIYSLNDEQEDSRFNPKHIEQWFALSRCPIVYHFIKTYNSDSNEITSTFAPTAAVYGGGEVIGVDNNGDMFHGQTYHW